MVEELLHSIDKRLAVLEALNKHHVKETEYELSQIRVDIETIKKEFISLKIKVAGISTTISLILGVSFAYFK